MKATCMKGLRLTFAPLLFLQEAHKRFVVNKAPAQDERSCMCYYCNVAWLLWNSGTRYISCIFRWQRMHNNNYIIDAQAVNT